MLKVIYFITKRHKIAKFAKISEGKALRDICLLQNDRKLVKLLELGKQKLL